MCFMARFLVQWIASERAGKSVVPIAFWFLSIFGAAGLLIYGFQRKEPVILIGQSTGMVIYIRNLMLIAKNKKENPLEEGEAN